MGTYPRSWYPSSYLYRRSGELYCLGFESNGAARQTVGKPRVMWALHKLRGPGMVLPSLMTPLSDNSERGALKPGCLRASSNSGPWRDMDDRPKRHLRHGDAQTWCRRCQLPEFLGQTLYSWQETCAVL